MAVMNRGRIVEAGPPEMLYSTPSTPFVAEFLGDGPVLELPAERRGDMPVVTLAGLTIPVSDVDEGAHPRDDPAARTVMIRPEHVALGEGALSGTVVSTAYRGYFSEVTVRLPDGTELMTRGQEATWALGDEVGVQVDRAHPVEPDVAADAD
jgi:ABC-type Fe3+/spermidine/putrescine transport system ATPase subunit